MIDYAILDTNFLENPIDLIIETLFIPYEIINELKTQQFISNFQLIQKKYKIIYTNTKLIPKTPFIDKNSEVIIINSNYLLISEIICKKLNVLCSYIDYNVIATTIFVECIYNKNELLFELINSNKLEIYLKEIENKKFSEWKSFNKIINSNKIIKCLTKDAGINTFLSFLYLNHLIFSNKINFIEKQFVLRCFTCKTIYKKERLFCIKCGNKTITRVSIRRDENNRLVLNIKKGFKFKPKIIKDKNGKEIMSEDSRQWNQINNKK